MIGRSARRTPVLRCPAGAADVGARPRRRRPAPRPGCERPLGAAAARARVGQRDRARGRSKRTTSRFASRRRMASERDDCARPSPRRCAWKCRFSARRTNAELEAAGLSAEHRCRPVPRADSRGDAPLHAPVPLVRCRPESPAASPKVKGRFARSGEWLRPRRVAPEAPLRRPFRSVVFRAISGGGPHDAFVKGREARSISAPQGRSAVDGEAETEGRDEPGSTRGDPEPLAVPPRAREVLRRSPSSGRSSCRGPREP